MVTLLNFTETRLHFVLLHSSWLIIPLDHKVVRSVIPRAKTEIRYHHLQPRELTIIVRYLALIRLESLSHHINLGSRNLAHLRRCLQHWHFQRQKFRPVHPHPLDLRIISHDWATRSSMEAGTLSDVGVAGAADVSNATVCGQE